MNDTEVLQAGTSHSAWEKAVLRLVARGIEKDAADAWLLARHWALTRVPDPFMLALRRTS